MRIAFEGPEPTLVDFDNVLNILLITICKHMYMAIASVPAGPVLAGPDFSSSAQRGFTIVGGHVMGGRDMHMQIHKFYLPCSATATEIYLSCVAMSRVDIPENSHQPRVFNFLKRSFGQNKVVMCSFHPLGSVSGHSCTTVNHRM